MTSHGDRAKTRRRVVIFLHVIGAVFACDDPSSGCFPLPSLAPLDWRAADELCRLAGASLPSPGNERDWAALSRLMTVSGLNETWLSAHEVTVDWMWAEDGAAVSPQGCYRDFVSLRDLPALQDLPGLVPRLCIDRCRAEGFAYAGTQSGDKCYCGDTYGAYNRTRGNQTCSVACRGDNTKTCGGWARNFIYRVDGGYASWAYKQPDNANGNEACGVLDGKTNSYLFADETCTAQHTYLCILGLPGSGCDAAAGGQLTGGGLCILTDTDWTGTWYKARDTCRHRGGQLASIDNETMHEDIKEYLMSSNDTRRAKHWIGLTSREWQDANGEPIRSIGLSAARQSAEPQCSAVISPHRTHWASNCSLARSVICQNVTVAATTVASLSTAAESERPATRTTGGNVQTSTPTDARTLTPNDTRLPGLGVTKEHAETSIATVTTSKDLIAGSTRLPEAAATEERVETSTATDTEAGTGNDGGTSSIKMTTQSERQTNEADVSRESDGTWQTNAAAAMTATSEPIGISTTMTTTTTTTTTTRRTTTATTRGTMPTTTTTSSQDDKYGGDVEGKAASLSVFYIILIVLGVIAGITGVMVVAFFALKKKKPRSVNSS